MDGPAPDPERYEVHVEYRQPSVADPEPDGPDRQPPAKPRMSRGRKILYGTLGFLVLAVLVVAGFLYWLDARNYASTDDAYVQAYISQVSPQVAGRVTELAIEDFQPVKAGQLLLRLDPRDYQVKLDQARAQRAQVAAQLDQAVAGLAQQSAAVDQAQANVRVAEADLAQAQADLGRFRAVDPKAVSRQQLDTADASSKSARAKVDANRQAVVAAQANVVAQRAQIEAARANLQATDVAVANAELQLSYTSITAPRDGQTAKRTVNVGDYVQPGQSLLAVVGTDRWIVANFKETELAGMKPGQRVTIAVDSCPDHELTGRVDSVQPGSGSIFSALPPENATGNFVKVVQRIPVRITLRSEDAARCRLSPGMSVVPSVRVR